MKKARLFTLYYYLCRHIIYTLLKKGYLHFKVKANLMDHHGFSHRHLNKPVILWCGCWGLSQGQFLQMLVANIRTYIDLIKTQAACLDFDFLCSLELVSSWKLQWHSGAFMSLESGAQLHDTSLGRRAQGLSKGQQRPSPLGEK